MFSFCYRYNIFMDVIKAFCFLLLLNLSHVVVVNCLSLFDNHRQNFVTSGNNNNNWLAAIQNSVSDHSRQEYYDDSGYSPAIVSKDEHDDYTDKGSSWDVDQLMLPHVGQIAAVAFNQSDKTLVIFHRGSTVWDANSFSLDDTFTEAGAGPIAVDPIIYYDPKTQETIGGAGKNMFYMPHGLSLGHDSVLWVTDVALHQVFRLEPTADAPFVKATLTLGEAFKPGSDDSHFCKPTSVVEASDGSIFVADGYCNSRILKFNGKTGKLITKFGQQSFKMNYFHSPKPGTFAIPHSLALIEKKDMICVADRENQRIQCFSAGLQNNKETGRFIVEMKHPEIYEVYAIKYAEKAEALVALSVDSYKIGNGKNSIFMIDTKNGQPFEAVSSPFIVNSHDIAVDDNVDSIYVSEIGPNRLWRVFPTDILHT